MRILWIEDNPEIKPEQEQTWFSKFLQTQQVERINDFSRAYEAIFHKLPRYDLVVLDINLEYSSPVTTSDFTGKIVFPKDRPFLEEAGFHLYLQLLEQGFPRNRVIFLTSNVNNPNTLSMRKELVERLKTANQSGSKQEYNQAIAKIMRMMPDNQGAEFDQKLKMGTKAQVFAWLDQWIQQGILVQDIEGETDKNTYEEFVTRFEAARLVPPEAYDKKRQDCSTNLQNWLWSHCERTSDNQPDYDYLTLRRGILDVITNLRQDSSVKLSKDFQEHLDKHTFLRGLEWQLRDFALPREDYNNVYFALCDYLTKPYDIYKVGDLSKDPFSHLKLHLKLPLSHLRNWIAHGLIMGSNTQISAQAAGVTFLMAMQSLFDVKHYGFQDELKRLFSVKSVTATDLRHQIKSLLSDYDRKDPLKALYKRGQKENPKWPQENYLRHFYAAYLFSIQQPDYSIRRDTDTELNAMVFHELNKQTE